MNISAPFIKRPVATTLLAVAFVLFGLSAVPFIPVSPLPQIAYPTIQVSASLPGASPETMASSVAAPLEKQFSNISNVTEMTSTSTLGSTRVVLQFDLNRDINGAARDVQAAINAAQSDLPTDLPSKPTYRLVNPAESPVLIISLTSETLQIPQIYDAASSILAQKISQIEGVGQVIVGGASLPSVRVELNPYAMSKYGLSINDVSNIITDNNRNKPKGQLQNEKLLFGIEADDQLNTAAGYRPLVVSFKNGAPVRLSDIAEVSDSVQNIRNAGYVNGKPSVTIIIFRDPQANIITTVNSVLDMLPQLEASISPAIDLHVVMNRTVTIQASINDAKMTILFSCILVIIVVFVFLGSVRATFIPGIVIPISLVSTLGVMYLLNFSIDNLSIMALTIATGFVVDDAIVVMENITRYIEEGLTPFHAAMKGASEIGATIMSISISLIAVFIPILLMGGIIGRLFREFAITLSVTIIMSLLVSLTVTPMMCAKILKGEKDKKEGKLSRLIRYGVDAMQQGYADTLSWALKHPRLMLGITVLAVFMNVVLFMIIPKGFFPQEDTGRLMGYVQASQDISFQDMKGKLQEIVDIVGKNPAVDTVTGFTGSSGSSTTNVARLFISLKPLNERAHCDEVMAQLRKATSHIPGAPAYFLSPQDLQIGGKLTAALFQYSLQSENLDELMKWAPVLLAELHKVPQIVDLNSDQQNKGLQTFITIDRNTASRLGISAEVIDNTLYGAFGQQETSTIFTQLNQYYVILEVAPRFWQRPEILRDIFVTSSKGEQIPLSAFAKYNETSTALAVNHIEQFPSVTFSFNLTQGASLGDAVKAIEKASRKIGLPADIQGSFQGNAQAFQASLANEPMLILAALIAVYIVLGMLYESFIHPITILSTLPSAGIGAILSLLICKIDLSVIALIGIILLIGIVKKNGIMMVDFAIEEERNSGKSPAEAIHRACLLRFRPIMMTTMAAMLGALPLVLSSGIGSELRKPLGVTIIGGLIFSQMLTLYTTPVIYLYFSRIQKNFKSATPNCRKEIVPD
ncbi:MAG TPA: multidrug transporter subunit MdtC [Lentisphaeria bacterium]|nr:MAG: multidrug transporter subunit MdtC [Lentisphaerae bacterium GWF2_38_69]HBM16529.1 multidrug transporter subunit MdtC [Lentisphaeria bacterium]